MVAFRLFKRVQKLVKLIGFHQAAKFCTGYLFFPRDPVKLSIEGVSTPLYCRPRDSDIQVLWQVFGERWFNLEDIAPPQLIVDGGAYTGYTAVFFATKYPDAKIIAIEPNDENCTLFRRNCAAYGNIELVQAAVWDSDIPLQIENPADPSWMLRMGEDPAAETPQLYGINLATILAASGFDTIDLLKLDIEGAEKVVFGRNYSQWLADTRHMLIELHERYTAGCDAIFYAAIEDEPYNISELGEYTILKRPNTWQPKQDQALFEPVLAELTLA